MPDDAEMLLPTMHCVARFRERVRKSASEKAIAALAADAKPPTDDEWRAIVRERRAKRTAREDCRVLGSIVFVVKESKVVTCWRQHSLHNGRPK